MKILKNQRSIAVSSFLIVFVLLLTTLPVLATATSIFDQANTGVKDAIEETYGGDVDPTVGEGKDPFMLFLFTIVNQLLTFLGIIFFLLLIYTGWLWMNARGNEEQVAKAKKMVREIVIGFIIIILAKVLTQFLLSQIATAVA